MFSAHIENEYFFVCLHVVVLLISHNDSALVEVQ